MLIYFAGPLFNSAEVSFNLQLAAKLEALGYEVFLPQRDGVESSKPPYNTMTKDERREAMFNLDRDTIFKSDIFLFILDGRVPDEGACVELGLAYADKIQKNPKRLLIGLHTDSRAAFLGGRLNPMIKVPLNFIAETEESLIEYLQIHKEKIK